MQIVAPYFVACLLVIAANAAFSQTAASVWKWRDSEGQIHISDTPPPQNVSNGNILQRPRNMLAAPSTPTKTVAAAATPAASASVALSPAASAPGVDSELQKKKRKTEQESAEKVATEKAAAEKKIAQDRADDCVRAKALASGLQNGAPMTRFDNTGARVYLTDSERMLELRRMLIIAEENCN